MKTEEKAKKYDEALEWMRELYPGLHGATKEDAEHYFPELKESEDERMMGVIRLALTDVPEERFTTEGTSLSKVLAWLEKQKEQKPLEYLSKEKVFAIMNKLTSLSFCVPLGSDEEKKIHEITCDVSSLLDYPIEQKPAEWSEEDEEMIEGIIGDLCALKDWIIKYDTNWLANPVLKNIDKRIAWLKSLKDRGNFPKSNTNSPSEWSEEDKEMLGKVLECIRFAEDHYQLEQEETNGVAVKSWLLDHIIPKPKQEWSEEDEHIIGRLRSIVQRYAFSDNALDVNGEFCEGDYAKLDEWLKSLPGRFSLQPQAKQEQKPEAKLTGWVARDENKGIWVYGNYPEKNSERHIWTESSCMPLDQKSFPDLKWEDEPVEVEITITKK